MCKNTAPATLKKTHAVPQSNKGVTIQHSASPGVLAKPSALQLQTSPAPMMYTTSFPAKRATALASTARCCWPAKARYWRHWR